MDIIEKLQRSRPEIVHVFDQIVKTLPDGIYLTGVKQTDQKFKFDGVWHSRPRAFSAFMRNIDSSEWLQHPELQVIVADGNTGSSSFTVSADEIHNAADAAAPVPGNKPGAPKNGGVRRGVSP